MCTSLAVWLPMADREYRPSKHHTVRAGHRPDLGERRRRHVHTCTRALAQGGRLIVIGMMSQYSDGWGASQVISTFLRALTMSSRDK